MRVVGDKESTLQEVSVSQQILEGHFSAMEFRGPGSRKGKYVQYTYLLQAGLFKDLFTSPHFNFNK